MKHVKILIKCILFTPFRIGKRLILRVLVTEKQ